MEQALHQPNLWQEPDATRRPSQVSTRPAVTPNAQPKPRKLRPGLY